MEKLYKDHCTVSPYLLFLLLPLHFYFCPVGLHSICSCFYPHHVNISSNNLITGEIRYNVTLALAFCVELTLWH